MELYIASYGKNEDKGIYIVELKDETFQLIKHIETKDYPSYIITKNSYLYVSYKNANSENLGGGLGSFLIQDKDLHLNNNYSSSGRSYTHLCVSEDDHYIFAANYHTGATAMYELNNHLIDHKIGAIRHKGLGPDLLKRQTGPHVHNVGFTPDGKYLYAVDLGSDKVVLYKYQEGHLVEDHHLSVTPGSGPRHMIFSKDGHFAYLINEIANSIMVYKYVDGHFNLIQDISTLPEHFKGFSSAAAIRLTESGNHLFVSNRGHDSIAMYRVNKQSGKLILLYMVHTGKGPRDFNIIDDQYLVVGAQEDNLIQLLTFDEEHEKLLLSNTSLEIPAPVCIAKK